MADKILKHPTSFKFRPDVMDKLEKIREYHQKIIDSAIYGSDSTIISNRAVVQGMIEKEYFDMVQEGLIKE
jgi:hypothetical protein